MPLGPGSAGTRARRYRFTRSKDNQLLYAIALKWPGKQLKLRSVRPNADAAISLLGFDKPLAWRFDAADGLVIDLPDQLQDESARPSRQAYAFKIRGGAAPRTGE